jgi:putative ABC transport system ATP-binding protein
MRRRVWVELVLLVVIWALILWAVATFGLWKYFIWMYLAPAFLAANLQSWRKYIEHVGMTGDTVNGSTRSIVSKSWMGRVVAFTLLHEPFHGVHHQQAGLPHSVLPRHVEKLQPKKPGERAPYPGYRYAFVELMRCLADPRVGPQWQALRGVDFSVNEGEFVAITGPSGCGKSTLLQLLGALDRPTSGTLLYRGISVPDHPNPAAYRAREVGFIFQGFHLLPTFTAAENVQIPMFEIDRSASERRERAFELLKLVGLENRLDHFPSKLSGGERQRVAIARSLANGPSLLLADEPTGNLDSENAHSVLELLIRLQQEQGRTMVLVTHDPTIAERAGRILRMKDGQIVSDGKP